MRQNLPVTAIEYPVDADKPTTAELKEKIAPARHEQGADTVQVNRAVAGMDANTQQNVAMVEQATGAAASPHEQSGRPRRQRRKDARPHELLAAASALFCANGYAATDMEQVARRAGVSKGTLYLYFGSKEELFKAVVRASEANIDIDDREAVFSGASVDVMRTNVNTWWARIGARDNSAVTRVLLAEAGQFPDLTRDHCALIIASSKAMITRIIERGIARGEFRPIDPVLLTQVLVAAMQTLLYWQHSTHLGAAEKYDSDQFLNMLVDVAANGLLAETQLRRSVAMLSKWE